MFNTLRQYKSRLIELLLCVAIPIGLYYPALRFPAFSDDFSLLVAVRNGHLHNWFSIRYLGGASIFLEQYLFGESFFVNHLFSLIYHGLTGFLALVVSQRIFIQYFRFDSTVSTRAAYLVGLLFLLYPFHLEAVFWISGRQIILATLFALLATHFHLRSESLLSKNGILSVLFYVFGLLSYESTLLLPIIWACLHVIRFRSISWKFMIWFPVLLLVYPLLSLLFGNFSTHTNYVRLHVGPLKYVKNSLALFIRVFTPPAESTWLFILMGATLMLGQLLIFRKYFKTRVGFYRGILVMTALLASLLPFVTVGIDTHDFESGRYLYFAAVIYLIILVGGIVDTLSKRASIFIAAIIAISFFIYSHLVMRTWQRSADVLIPALSTLPVFKENVVIGNVLDSYRGAYVFRNGLWSAFDYFENKNLGYGRSLTFSKVTWDQFLDFERRYKTFSAPERSAYIDELRTLHRKKYLEIPDSAISVYLFTRKGIIRLSEEKSSLISPIN